MSLYNAIFGVNRMAPHLLAMLGITTSDVPRFRDCYMDDKGRIVIYTRTGGGNRPFYDCEEGCRDHYPEYFRDDEPPRGPWNSDLRKLPGFLYDSDDDFDCTYAYFYFNVPQEFKDMLAELQAVAQAPKPREKWDALFTSMSGKAETPEAKRALEVGQQIFAQIESAISTQEGEAG